jgi:pimeloyl-ACP methyl ester carboxylesterase
MVEATPLHFDITQHEQSNTVPSGQFRRVYLIHGLGGNAGSFSRIADALQNAHLNIPDFGNRKVYCYTPDYSLQANSTLNYASRVVMNQIMNQNALDYQHWNLNPKYAILIGHSQGGIIGRTLLHFESNNENPLADYGANFGGFISIAGPLQGAPILNNRDLIPAMFNYACQSFSEILEDKWFLNGVLKAVFGKNYMQFPCEFLSFTVLPMFFHDYYDGITDDYMVGASYLNILNQDQFNEKYQRISKICLVPQEPREKLFWRTINAMIIDPNTKPHFQADNDFEFYDQYIAPIYNKWYATWKTSYDRVNYLDNNPFIKFWCYANYIHHRNKMNAYRPGLDWFDNINPLWEVIIGARIYTAIGQGNYTTTLTPSDGVLPVGTMSGLPSQTSSPIEVFYRSNPYNAKTDGTSHMQARNDSGIKIALNDVFEGRYGRFFRTELN